MNCPGCHAGIVDSPAGTSCSVRVSAVSRLFFQTRKSVVNIGSGTCSTRGGSINVQELQTCVFEPLHKNPREPFHEVVAHDGVAVTFGTQAFIVETDRPHFFHGAYVKAPAIWGEQP